MRVEFSSSNVSNVTIIPFYNVSNYLITVNDEDGNISYFFINTVYKIKSAAQKIDDSNLLIDEDNDGVWDHQYNSIIGLYSPYSPSQKISENQQVLIINQLIVYILTIISAIIFLAVYFRHNIYSFFSSCHLRLPAHKSKNTNFYVNNKSFKNNFNKY